VGRGGRASDRLKRGLGAEQDVHEHRTGQKVYRHPEVGEVDMTFDVFELPGEPGLSICTYSAEEGTPSADRFASWAATQEFGHRATKVDHEP
jgi:hypothetical protein